MNFLDKLDKAIHASKTQLCLGFDPRLDQIPGAQGGASPVTALRDYGFRFLEVGRNYAASVKFQSAFFEALGWSGFKVLEELCDRARRLDYLIILDAKRGDISSTMEAYGRAAFDNLGADVLTVLSYMGYDTIAALTPWLRKGCGVYVVLISSNESGREFQELQLANGAQVYEGLEQALTLGLRQDGLESGLGYVVGATKVDSLSEQAWSSLQHKPLLLPGFGAQGAEVGEVRSEQLRAGRHLIPISRGLLTSCLQDANYWDCFARNVQKWSGTFATV